MRKLIPFCIAALLLWGCSASSPSVTAANSSDSTPVTGQKVLFQVVSVSDNPPMTYTWDCGGIGELESVEDDLGDTIGYYEYWTAPEDYSGPATVTCTITDDEGKTETQVFYIDVQPRELASIKDENGVEYNINAIEKQDTTIAGVWFSTQQEKIRYITSAADQLSSWTGTFGTMHIGYDDNTNYTLWGAPAQGNTISAETSNTITSITLSEIGLTDSIKDMILFTHITQGTSLLIGTNVSGKGAYAYNLSLQQWDDIISDETYQFFSGNSYTYAATSAGIYRISELEAVELLYSGDSCAVLEADDKTTDAVEADIWHVTKDGGGFWKVCKNGTEFPTQPDVVAGTLDVDLKGRIWCGKYRWDGSAWSTPSDPNNDLVGETIKTVIASTEGRIYFLTQSGTLFRW